jgi:threonine dehydratase
MTALSIDDVRAAAAGFGPSVRRTPLLGSATLSALTGGDVRLKAENLQHTGSFKIRGASNRIAALTLDERARGVIAASAGNHAQGVAVAATACGVRATIVMPYTTPLAKIQATRDYGGDVVLHGEHYEEARAEAARRAGEQGSLPISAFDDPLIVAGQGTVGLEIIEDFAGVEAVIVPLGGGGLIGGIGLAIKSLAPRTRMIGVQVAAATGAQASLDAGRPVIVTPGPTIAEGVAVGGPGDVTFPLLQHYVDEVAVVTDDEVAQAMALLIERSKLVVEGAGAVGVAALMSGKMDLAGKRTAVVISGGNVDINMLARVVEHGLMQAGRYLSLSVAIDDKPGELTALSSVIAASGANILSVAHHRFGIDLPVGRVQVVLLLEVRNANHASEVRAALEERGFSVAK